MLNSQLYFDLRNFSLGGHINFYLKGELVCQPPLTDRKPLLTLTNTRSL